jgi:hypothetical protein
MGLNRTGSGSRRILARCRWLASGFLIALACSTGAISAEPYRPEPRFLEAARQEGQVRSDVAQDNTENPA